MGNYTFGNKSISKLNEVHEDLKKLMYEALKASPIDFGISCGRRGIEEQNKLFKEGKTKCDGINIKSKHNYMPALAVDFYPYINGKASWDKVHLALVAGVILATADKLGINVRWGGTFGSKEFKGWDYPHIEKW